MLSRANLLIQRDFEDLKEKPYEGIEIDLISPDDVYEWTVKIKGNQGSIWEGGIFILILKFGEQYNEMPPEVFFYTVPFHPNVDPVSGYIGLDLLNSKTWETSHSILNVLSDIQDLLCHPVLERNVLNKQARDMYIESPHAYRQIIADCVRHSQQIELGLNPDIEDEYKSLKQIPVLNQGTENMQVTQKTRRNFNKVSFEDYHFTWSDIATCKAKADLENSYLESLKKNSKLYEMHTGQKLEKLSQQISPEQQEELSILMYGNFKQSKMKDNKKECLTNVRKMKKLYLHSLSDQMNAAEKSSSARLEPNDNEVNDLLKWSSNLDCSRLDNH